MPSIGNSDGFDKENNTFASALGKLKKPIHLKSSSAFHALDSLASIRKCKRTGRKARLNTIFEEGKGFTESDSGLLNAAKETSTKTNFKRQRGPKIIIKTSTADGINNAVPLIHQYNSYDKQELWQFTSFVGSGHSFSRKESYRPSNEQNRQRAWKRIPRAHRHLFNQEATYPSQGTKENEEEWLDKLIRDLIARTPGDTLMESYLRWLGEVELVKKKLKKVEKCSDLWNDAAPRRNNTFNILRHHWLARAGPLICSKKSKLATEGPVSELERLGMETVGNTESNHINLCGQFMGQRNIKDWKAFAGRGKNWKQGSYAKVATQRRMSSAKYSEKKRKTFTRHVKVAEVASNKLWPMTHPNNISAPLLAVKCYQSRLTKNPDTSFRYTHNFQLVTKELKQHVRLDRWRLPNEDFGMQVSAPTRYRQYRYNLHISFMVFIY